MYCVFDPRARVWVASARGVDGRLCIAEAVDLADAMYSVYELILWRA